MLNSSSEYINMDAPDGKAGREWLKPAICLLISLGVVAALYTSQSGISKGPATSVRVAREKQPLYTTVPLSYETASYETTTNYKPQSFQVGTDGTPPDKHARFMVRIYRTDKPRSEECSGVILSPTVVLTSANCLGGNVVTTSTNRVAVLGGTKRVSNHHSSSNGPLRHVNGFHLAPNGVNLAIATLSSPFEFNDRLGSPIVDIGLLPTEKLATTGWGYEAPNLPTMRERLLVPESSRTCLFAGLVNDPNKDLCMKYNGPAGNCGGVGSALIAVFDNQPIVAGILRKRNGALCSHGLFSRFDTGITAKWIFALNRHQRYPVVVDPFGRCWDYYGCDPPGLECSGRRLPNCHTVLPPLAPPPVLRRLNDVFIHGYDSYTLVADATACGNLCEQNEKCLCATYHYFRNDNEKRCWMTDLSSICKNGKAPNGGAVSFIRASCGNC